jgi:ankyrin repeat protein
MAQPQEVIDAYNLENAIKGGDTAKVQELINNGVNVNVQYNGKNGLHVACETGSPELVELLLGAGAEVNSISDGGGGMTSLQMVTWGFGVKKSMDVFKLLLNNDADPNLSNGRYEYPLFYAIEARDPEMVQLLIDSGARLDVKSKSGKTPLEYVDYVDKVMTNSGTSETDKQKLQEVKALLAKTNSDTQTPSAIDTLRIE